MRTYFLFAILYLLFCAPSAPPRVTISWTHAPGPYLYRIYRATNLANAVFWPITNTPNLQITLPANLPRAFFAVTCLDTNTGLESAFGTK